MRLLHGADRWRAGEVLRQGAVHGRRQERRHDRGAGHAGAAASPATGVSRRAGRAMRLLPAGHPGHRQGAARQEPGAVAARNRGGARREYLPLRLACPHRASRRARRGRYARRSPSMSTAAAPVLPGMLAANPRLDQWVRFAAPGQVTVSTGRVEIGQGVLTAMRQIAAEELDVSPDRILLQTGDTELTPNEGYTAGSQSIQFGGVALRLACAEVRGLFLDHAASQLGHARAELSVDDGAILHRGQPTGQDFWTLAAMVDLAREATGRSPIKKTSEHRIVGRNLPRVDLADKVFG